SHRPIRSGIAERCLACEAEGSPPWRGAAFTRTPFARTFLKPRVYQVGVCEQAAPANVSRRPYHPARCSSFSTECDAIRPNRIREAHRLRNTTVVYAISSGYGPRLKAAPLHGWPPLGLASEAALQSFAILGAFCSVNSDRGTVDRLVIPL